MCLNDIRSYAERVIYLRYDIALCSVIYALRHIENGYYIIFLRSGNISYGKAVYHVSQETYHFDQPKKKNYFFGRYLPFPKYVTHYDTFFLKVSFSSFAQKKENTSLRSVSVAMHSFLMHNAQCIVYNVAITYPYTIQRTM